MFKITNDQAGEKIFFGADHCVLKIFVYTNLQENIQIDYHL